MSRQQVTDIQYDIILIFRKMQKQYCILFMDINICINSKNKNSREGGKEWN